MNGVIAAAVLTALAGVAGEEHRPEETQYPLRAQCAMNLIEIGKHLQLFALARDGALPSSFSELFGSAPSDGWQRLVCPEARPRTAKGGLHPCYAYVRLSPGGRKTEDGAEDVVAFDAEPVHQGGRNVLFSDLKTVRYVAEREFQKLLAEQEEKWQKQGRTLDVLTDDLVPLSEAQLRAIERGGRPFFRSPHFAIVLALAAAIGVVLALLVRRSRSRQATG